MASLPAVYLVVGRMLEDSSGADPDGIALEFGLPVPEGLQCLGRGGCFVGVPVRTILREGLGPVRADGLTVMVPCPDFAEAHRLCAALPREWTTHPRLGPLGTWLLLTEG